MECLRMVWACPSIVTGGASRPDSNELYRRTIVAAGAARHRRDRVTGAHHLRT